MPLDDTTYYGNNERRDPRLERICSRIEGIISKLEKLRKKIGEMNFDSYERMARESILMMGFGIAEARVLAEEGGSEYIGKIAEILAETKREKDGVYAGLIRGRKFSPELFYGVGKHPLAVKAENLYEKGELMIIKYLEGKK